METTAPTKPEMVSSLFEGIEPIIDQAFGDAKWRRPDHFAALCKSPPRSFDARALLGSIYNLLSSRWQGLLPGLRKLPPSSQNWRWCHPKTKIDPKNDGPEQTLERAIVRACRDCGRLGWSNQIPMASGIIGPRSNKTTAIDLMHFRGSNSFDVIELKVGSNTPISAAFQVIQYGIIWALSSRDREKLRYPNTPILSATSINLSVLAPYQYYRDADLNWLSVPLSDGTAAIAKQVVGADMGLAFEAFPQAFNWPADYTSEQICGFLDNRIRR